MAGSFTDDVFLALVFGVTCVSALSLFLLVMRLSKQPASRRRNLIMAGVVVGFVVGTPVLLYVILVIKYLCCDAWH